MSRQHWVVPGVIALVLATSALAGRMATLLAQGQSIAEVARAIRPQVQNVQTVALWTWTVHGGAAPEPQTPAKPELLHSIEWQDVEQGFPAHIFQTGISPDGKLFFGAGDGGPTAGIRVYELVSGKLVHDLRPGENVWYSSAAFVPGSKYLAACYKDDRDLYLWDLETGKVARKFTGHTDTGIGFVVSPNGKQILSWSDDSPSLRIWDVDTGKQVRTLQGHTEKATAVFSPNGKTILSFSNDRTLRLWDALTGKEIRKFTGQEEACTASFAPDSDRIVSFGADQTIRLWNVATGKEIRRLEGAVVKDGMRGFIAKGAQVAAFCDDMRYRIWDAATGKQVREIDLADLGGDRWTITPSPDGRLGLVNHEDGSVRVYDLTTGKDIHTYENCRKARAFSFSPDGKYAVGGSFRAGLFVFRLPSLKESKP